MIVNVHPILELLLMRHYGRRIGVLYTRLSAHGGANLDALPELRILCLTPRSELIPVRWFFLASDEKLGILLDVVVYSRFWRFGCQATPSYPTRKAGFDLLVSRGSAHHTRSLYYCCC
jgi:hypothetical protein